MLALTLKLGDTIYVIQPQAKLVGIGYGKVKLSFLAPREIVIDRAKVRRAKLAGARRLTR